jgi:hypothetical protein
MSDAAQHTVRGEAVAPSRAWHFGLWAVQLLLGAAFIMGGLI